MYMDGGVNDEIKNFYARDHTAKVIGDEAFLTWVPEKKLPELDDKVFIESVLPGTLTMAHIINLVCRLFKDGGEAINLCGQRYSKRFTRSQSGPVSQSRAWGVSLNGGHTHVWFVLCRIHEFYRDPDPEPQQQNPGLRQNDSSG